MAWHWRLSPGLGELASLLEQLRKAGVPVELREEGEPRQLPAGHDLVAYRVVQEGLTNVLKHAGKANVQVTVRFSRRRPGPGSGR